MLLIKLVAAKL